MALLDLFFSFNLFGFVQYYSEATEADTWMNEKAALAANPDVGKDEDSDEKYLTRHKVFTTSSHWFDSILDVSCSFIFMHNTALSDSFPEKILFKNVLLL